MEFDKKRMSIDPHSGAIIIKPTAEERELMQVKKKNRELERQLHEIQAMLGIKREP